jgi:hypothetical protein
VAGTLFTGRSLGRVQRSKSPDRSQFYIVPFPDGAHSSENAWIPVTDGGFEDNHPAWSPNGRMLYFTSNRDGRLCLWAQPLDASMRLGFRQAEILARRSLEAWESARGREHPDVAAALNNLAEIHRRLEQSLKAETLYKRALYIFEKIYGPDHPEVASVLITSQYCGCSEATWQGRPGCFQSCCDLAQCVRPRRRAYGSAIRQPCRSCPRILGAHMRSNRLDMTVNARELGYGSAERQVTDRLTLLI